MNISGPFIRRPIATTLLSAAVLLAGLAAYWQLPVAPLPKVEFPTINASANLPGASPETMASSVATPLERRFGRIAGLTELTSTSSLGSTSLTLQFDLDRDVTSAARDVQAAINAAGGELPTNLPSRPNYRKVNPADAPILIVALTSDTLPLAQVYDAANTILAQKVSQLEGVGQVFVGGGQQPAVRVQVDLPRLAALGLGTDDVRTALGQANANQPKGAVASGGHSYVIAANDQLFGAEAFRNIIISNRNGTPVRLGDVAKVFDDVENNRAAGWFDHERAVLLIIRRQPDANILETIDRVKAILPRLTTSISPAIKLTIASDRAQTIRASVADVELTLVISIGLVVLVVFAFLRDGRATLIPSVAIPLSLCATFAVMYLLGYSLNNLSLMALTIATGFVVDDAIVVTENVSRFIEEGLPVKEAALRGARQIGFTIVSITVSLLAVFIPILLMGGIVGRLFREFAVTLSVAITASALVSLTLTPMLCAQLLRPKRGEERAHGEAQERRGFSGRLLAFYDRALVWALRHRLATLLLSVLSVALTVGLATFVPKGLFPQQDTGMVMGFSEAGQDVSFLAMRARQKALNDVVMSDPDVEHMVSFTGGSMGSSENTGTMFLTLKLRSHRKASADAIIARLRPKLARIPGVNLFLQAVQDVRVGGRTARTQYQYTLQDANLDELRAWAPKLLERLRKVPILRDVVSDQQTSGLLLALELDRDAATRLGVTPGDVDNALYDAYGQRQVSISYTALNYYRVVLESLPEQQGSPDSLRNVYVHSASGAAVPLSELVKSKIQPTSLSITHQGQFPSVTISFNVDVGRSLGEAITQIEAAQREIGLPEGLRGSFQGTAQAFTASLSSQPWLILAALIGVYIVLGMLYESLIHPITILSTLPSAGVGALLALLLLKTELSIIALIGIILLIGIVKKNAIMLVDFAIESERDRALSSQDAIHEAALLRVRPILMTTLAALLGGLPLALGTGTGAELRRPLGITIVGGLLLSQLVTLFTTPVIYVWLDGVSTWWRGRVGKRSAHEPVRDPAPAR